jgi:hypothetical protein
MRIVRLGLMPILLAFVSVFSAPAQDALSAPAAATAGSPSDPSGASVPSTQTQVPPSTFNDVLDHVVQREHLFMAQMRHMHPMVET